MTAGDADKLWGRAGGRCAICARRVADAHGVPSGSPPGIEVVIPTGFNAGSQLNAMPAGGLHGYEDMILLCEMDAQLLQRSPSRFTPKTLRSLKQVREADAAYQAANRSSADPGTTRVLFHTGVFGMLGPQYYFLKIVNLSGEVVTLDEVWFATEPASIVENPTRPLPAELGPGDLFETWTPASNVPYTADVAYLGRVRLGDGRVLSSIPNTGVAPAGTVGGAGRPISDLVDAVTSLNHVNGSLKPRKWDVFISYASTDRAQVVHPLAERLQAHRLSVWYDRFELRIGDNLRRRIDEGIANSAFGVVILSPAYLSKRAWTEYELDGLVTRSVDGSQILLPVWHGIQEHDLRSYSPALAGRVAGNTASQTIEELAADIAQVVHAATRTSQSNVD